MRVLVALALIAGCDKGQQRVPPPSASHAEVIPPTDVPPEARAANVDAFVATNDPDAVEIKRLAREARLPARTACKPDCEGLHPKDTDTRCGAAAPGVAMTGTREDGRCTPHMVWIDCCHPIDPADTQAVAQALGWDGATDDQKVAIAWVIARIAKGTEAIETKPDDFPPSAKFIAPTAKLDTDGVVLDYWVYSPMDYEAYQHHLMTFVAAGYVLQHDVKDSAAPVPVQDMQLGHPIKR